MLDDLRVEDPQSTMEEEGTPTKSITTLPTSPGEEASPHSPQPPLPPRLSNDKKTPPFCAGSSFDHSKDSRTESPPSSKQLQRNSRSDDSPP
ncbi:UNVERIFIED_CONTAM: hypothetical protein Sradi_4414500 [Sesamum radiatum]|uniref:Uncharacterized protein n=1 Tax=Sesamum radiatum TaxID=300843 RepID=A0AAW2NQQ5_SESRA